MTLCGTFRTVLALLLWNPAAGGGRARSLVSQVEAVLAGAGVRGGIVYGRSDKDAAYPAEHPVSPEDLAATLFHALGIDPGLRIQDPQGRPVPLVDGGTPLLGLFA